MPHGAAPPRPHGDRRQVPAPRRLQRPRRAPQPATDVAAQLRGRSDGCRDRAAAGAAQPRRHRGEARRRARHRPALRPRFRRGIARGDREPRGRAQHLSRRLASGAGWQTAITGNESPRESEMQTIKRGEVPSKYAFDWEDEPVLQRGAGGRHFELETDDALSGLIADDSDDPTVHDFTGEHVVALQSVWPPKYNPVVGPIYVEGCARGDTLAVSIRVHRPLALRLLGHPAGDRPAGRFQALGRLLGGARPGDRALSRPQRPHAGRHRQVFRQAHLGPDALLRHARVRAAARGLHLAAGPGPLRRQHRLPRRARRPHHPTSTPITTAGCSMSATCTAGRGTPSSPASPTRPGRRSSSAPR